ncbi:hypothetical protein [Kitasatospora purpeofusca]|uniref:hypothetical protein n=1 Tax=Kitasatospora purpeofusca TaxID=67352 RepID=UPI002A59B776|nr:hypothetical protein [Kitasatospora purpeofusca]MDY0810353.1 hypothetical protein [Kitasatospora purpeofusca]
MPATGVPQYRRLVAGGMPAAAAPAMLPEAADDRGPACPLSGGGPSRRPAADQDRAPAAAHDTVTVALRHGLEAVDILRLRRACGAVLQSRNGATVSFLVPAGTSATWHLPGSSCAAGSPLPPATDPRWVMPPAGADCTARPTDAWVLRSALCEAACTLAAGGFGQF